MFVEFTHQAAHPEVAHPSSAGLPPSSFTVYVGNLHNKRPLIRHEIPERTWTYVQLSQPKHVYTFSEIQTAISEGCDRYGSQNQSLHLILAKLIALYVVDIYGTKFQWNLSDQDTRHTLCTHSHTDFHFIQMWQGHDLQRYSRDQLNSVTHETRDESLLAAQIICWYQDLISLEFLYCYLLTSVDFRIQDQPPESIDYKPLSLTDQEHRTCLIGALSTYWTHHLLLSEICEILGPIDLKTSFPIPSLRNHLPPFNPGRYSDFSSRYRLALVRASHVYFKVTRSKGLTLNMDSLDNQMASDLRDLRKIGQQDPGAYMRHLHDCAERIKSLVEGLLDNQLDSTHRAI